MTCINDESQLWQTAHVLFSLYVRVSVSGVHLCRRGKVHQVDAKAGVAHVELLQEDQDQDEKPAEKTEQQPDEVAATAAPALSSTAGAQTDGQGRAPAGDDASRVFFLLKVRARAFSNTRLAVFSCRGAFPFEGAR